MGDLLAKKAFETFLDSRVAKLKVDTIGDTLAMKKANRLLDALVYRLVEKEVQTLGNTSPKVKRCKHCSRH